MAVNVPVWALTRDFGYVRQAHYRGALTDDQWGAYRAIWRYSAPRFSDIAGDDLPSVRDANKTLDVLYPPR